MSESGKNEHFIFRMLRNITYDLKQNMVIGGPPPSLEFLSLSRIAISLYKSQVKNFNEKGNNVIFYVFHIQDLISDLTIPKLCKKSLESLVWLMGIEIRENFLLNKLITYKKFEVYLANICWNQEGTFNVLKTVMKIIDKSNLSTLEKYELACDFCLKETIRDLQKLLSENDIKTLEDKETYSLSAFWSLYIKEESLPTLIKGIETRDYLLNCLEIPQSEVALQFIWENFADEIWNEQLVDIVSIILTWEKIHLYNIAFYFSKQMNQYQLEEIGNYFHSKVLEKLHTISKWRNVVPIIEYVFNLIKTNKCLSQNFSIIRHCWNDRPFLNYENLINLWNLFIQQHILDFEKIIIYYYNNLMKRYRYQTRIRGTQSVLKQGIMAQLILRVANSEDRKKMIYCRETMTYCQRLLVEVDSQLLDLFLTQILKKENISHFKKKLFKVRRISIFTSLIMGNHELLDKILIEFCTDETISEFKEKYYIDILGSILRTCKIMIKNPVCGVYLLTHIWNLLSFCCDGNKKKMVKYKALVFDLDSVLYKDIRGNFFYILKIFIRRGQWNLVRKYWKWIFSANTKSATKPMEKFALSKKIFIAMYGNECSLSLLKKKNCHGLIKKIIISCFSQDEVEELKEKLQHSNDLSLLVRELIELENFLEVDDFLEWSFSSTKSKIADFKSMFLNVFGCSLLFQYIARYDDSMKAKSLLAWFNPCYGSAKRFKKNFLSYIENKKKSHSNELSSDDEVAGSQGIECKRLEEIFFKSLELLKCYVREKNDLDNKRKVAAGQDSLDKEHKVAAPQGSLDKELENDAGQDSLDREQRDMINANIVIM